MVGVPWQLRILSKMVLARLPVQYSLWKRVGIFDCGQMEKPGYAYKVFKHHYEQAEMHRRAAGFVMLELGPGDSMASGVIAHFLGASKTYLVDQKPYADQDVRTYQRLIAFLQTAGLSTEADQVWSTEELKTRYNIHYMTRGLASLQQIPTASVDFIWSQVVLEMVRLHDLKPLMQELRRILRPGGVCSHCIDLSDLIVHSLNNLRFPQQLWESNFMVNSQFYTNRLRFSEYLNLFEQSGFEAKVVGVQRWDKLPVPRQAMHPQFQQFSDDELRISEMNVVLRPRA